MVVFLCQHFIGAGVVQTNQHYQTACLSADCDLGLCCARSAVQHCHCHLWREGPQSLHSVLPQSLHDSALPPWGSQQLG